MTNKMIRIRIKMIRMMKIRKGRERMVMRIMRMIRMMRMRRVKRRRSRRMMKVTRNCPLLTFLKGNHLHSSSSHPFSAKSPTCLPLSTTL